MVNIMGSRSAHGFIHDFIHKLRSNPGSLEMLGDGTQSKSHLHVSDCVRAILFAMDKLSNPIEIFNIGSEDRADVRGWLCGRGNGP
jgi:UDP-glucose 4-epimerase